MIKTSNVAELQSIAKQMRREIVEMITHAKSGHPGGSLSAVEILVTLFFDVMRHDPANPKWPDRDRFILSKGHAAPVLYSVMAECGYTPKDQLNTLRKLGSIYQGHPDVRFIPSLEASTGSLGEGLSIGIGMSLAAKLDQRPSRTYVVLGDGENQEGQIWESATSGRRPRRWIRRQFWRRAVPEFICGWPVPMDGAPRLPVSLQPRDWPIKRANSSRRRSEEARV